MAFIRIIVIPAILLIRISNIDYCYRYLGILSPSITENDPNVVTADMTKTGGLIGDCLLSAFVVVVCR